MKKKLFLAGIIFLCALGFIYHYTQDSNTLHKIQNTKKIPLTVMLDWAVNPNHGPIIIAQKKGFFKQAGLKVSIEEPSDPVLPLKLVAVNKVDIAVSYESTVMEAIANNHMPLLWAGTLIDKPLDGLMVLDSSDIKQINDLKGKTIGTSGNRGAATIMLNALLNPYGLSAKDIHLVSLSWSLSAALMSKRVDGIVGGYRNIERNILSDKHVKTRMFFYEKQGVPSYSELIFIVNKNHVNPEIIKRFLHAINRATAFIIHYPNNAWNIFKTYHSAQSDTSLNKQIWMSTLPYFAKNSLVLDDKKVQKFIDFLYKFRGIKHSLQAHQVILHLDAKSN